jgi:F0F1-type ATP synthase assembly protein I
MPDDPFDQFDESSASGSSENEDDDVQAEPYSPPSTEETVRRSGLAWSVGIIFFGSVAFTLFLGWIADVLFGSSPWGLVGGIVLGSIIGFLQFFRISSKIYDPEGNKHQMSPLLSHRDDADDQ